MQRMLFDEKGFLMGDEEEGGCHFRDLFPSAAWEEICRSTSGRSLPDVKIAGSDSCCRLEVFPTVWRGERAFVVIVEETGAAPIAGRLEDLRKIIDSMPFGAALIDRDKRVHFMNRAALKLAGYESFEEYAARGLTCQESFCPAPIDGCPIWDEGALFDHAERPFLLRDGTKIPVEKTAVAVTIDGREMMLEGIVDLRPQKAAEKAAQTDALTGMLNRLGLCRHAARFECASGYSVLVVDVDNLKDLNDRWGHSEGDKAIRIVGTVLAEVVSENGVAARWGGDEFVLFERGQVDDEELEGLCRRICTAVSERSSRLPVPVTVSVGCARSLFAGERWEEVFERADHEMYHCKEQSRRAGSAEEEAGGRCYRPRASEGMGRRRSERR